MLEALARIRTREWNESDTNMKNIKLSLFVDIMLYIRDAQNFTRNV